jgi:Fe-S-cluster-containing hydrogenase component 2
MQLVEKDSFEVSSLRVKRERRKKVEVTVDADFLSTLPIFSLLDSQTRGKIAPRLQRLEFKRNQSLYQGPPTDEQFSPVYFVLSGDLAIYRYIGQGDQAREEVSAYISVGEAYIQKLHHQVESSEETTLEIRAMCPALILSFTYQELNYLLSKSDDFRHGFSEMIREVTQRQVTRFDDDFQKEIAAFFVKERLTFARRVKIKRMDICIECDGCYTACRDRHGTDRLGSSEVKYGITEIPNNCHNCVVPECIDKCKYGHITRHEMSGEIVISDNCVGCAACSKGCSFNAIQMHPIDTLDMERYFTDRSPEARGKQIAQKCDNCTEYEDQACVTACPTGALFQVDGPDLFDHWEQFNVHKNPGFDQVISPEDSANLVRPWGVAITLLTFILITYECLTRVWSPTLCFAHLFYEWGWSTTDIDLAKPLRAGKSFGHILGYLGSVCMLLTQTYTIGRKLAPKLGSVQLWFEAHIWFGFLGFIFGFYHTAFNWREPIAVTTFSLFTITMITGMIGRYLVFYIPRNQVGRELTLAEVDSELQAVNKEIETRFQDRRQGYTMMMRIDQLQSVLSQTSDAGKSHSHQTPKGIEKIRQFWRELLKLRKNLKDQDAQIDELKREVEGQTRLGEANAVLKLLKKRTELKRSVTRSRWVSKTLKSYRLIHVGIGQLTFVTLLVHILHALKVFG